MADDLNLYRAKGLQCHNCSMRIYWDFGSDQWRHSYDQGLYCSPALEDTRVAHPKIRS